MKQLRLQVRICWFVENNQSWNWMHCCASVWRVQAHHFTPAHQCQSNQSMQAESLQYWIVYMYATTTQALEAAEDSAEWCIIKGRERRFSWVKDFPLKPKAVAILEYRSFPLIFDTVKHPPDYYFFVICWGSFFTKSVKYSRNIVREVRIALLFNAKKVFSKNKKLAPCIFSCSHPSLPICF